MILEDGFTRRRVAGWGTFSCYCVRTCECDTFHASVRLFLCSFFSFFSSSLFCSFFLHFFLFLFSIFLTHPLLPSIFLSFTFFFSYLLYLCWSIVGAGSIPVENREVSPVDPKLSGMSSWFHRVWGNITVARERRLPLHKAGLEKRRLWWWDESSNNSSTNDRERLRNELLFYSSSSFFHLSFAPSLFLFFLVIFSSSWNRTAPLICFFLHSAVYWW